MAKQFWSRWVVEFLPNLAYHQKWFKPQTNLQINDVVLLAEDLQHRSKWLMGPVADTYPDKKGRVRTVKVQTKNGTILQLISKLCVILKNNSYLQFDISPQNSLFQC